MEIRINVNMPKKEFKASGYIDACAEVMKSKTGPELRALFLQTIFGWSPEKKPGFTRQLTRQVYKVSMRVYTNSNYEIYSLVSKGAPAHIIRPVKAKVLRFKPGYRAATTPGQIQSRRAYRSGTEITATVVHHPGFQDRSFDSFIANEYEPTFTSDMQDAMNNAAKRQ